jgi:flagellar hook-length control protein FliK
MAMALGKGASRSTGASASIGGASSLTPASGRGVPAGSTAVSALPLAASADPALQPLASPFTAMLAGSLIAGDATGGSAGASAATDPSGGLVSDLGAALGAAPPWSGLTGAPTAGPTLGVNTPMASPAWASEFSQTLQVMVRNGSEEAQIRLNPEALGPISVNLSVSGGQLSLVLTAAASETRALIEAQMPQLRESLGASGLQLADAQVQAGNPGMSDSNQQAWQSAQGQSGRQPSNEGTRQGVSSGTSERDGSSYGVNDTRSGTLLAPGMAGLRRVDTFA